MAYKLLQNKAYNHSGFVRRGVCKFEPWTIGGIAFAERDDQPDLRLRKDTLDMRSGIPVELKALFLGQPFIDVTHFAYDDENVEVFYADGSDNFQAVYFEYFETRYKFATKRYNPQLRDMVWFSNDEPVAVLAARDIVELATIATKDAGSKITKGLH